MSLEFDIQRYLDFNLTSRFDDNQYFDIKYAVPITLNVESFIFIKKDCKHNIHHIFRLPVKTEIKWKIKGGTENVLSKQDLQQASLLDSKKLWI